MVLQQLTFNPIVYIDPRAINQGIYVAQDIPKKPGHPEHPEHPNVPPGPPPHAPPGPTPPPRPPKDREVG